MAPRERITTAQGLLDYAIGRYSFFKKIADSEPSDHISKFYLRDFMRDMLLIQHYAHALVNEGTNESNKRGAESLADVS